METMDPTSRDIPGVSATHMLTGRISSFWKFGHHNNVISSPLTFYAIAFLLMQKSRLWTTFVQQSLAHWGPSCFILLLLSSKNIINGESTKCLGPEGAKNNQMKAGGEGYGHPKSQT